MKTLPLAVILSVVLLSGQAAAMTTYQFSTTSDFDSGTKVNASIATPQDYFVNNAVDQPTYSFISSPTSIYVSGLDRTYTVWEATSLFLPYMAYYDHGTHRWSQPFQVATYNPVAGDGHGAPAIWIDASGYVYVFWGAHSTKFQLYVTVHPYDLSSWSNRTSVMPLGSYAHLFESLGYVYLMYRMANLSWTWERTNDHGFTWSAGYVFLPFSVGVNGWYVYHDILTGGYLYYNMVRYGLPDGNRYDDYVCKWNLGNNHQYGINGVDLGLSISLAEANANCRAVNGGTQHTWSSAMGLDTSNRPYLIYTSLANGTTSDWNWNTTHWNGSAWSPVVTFTTTDGSTSYADMQRNGTGFIAYVTTAGLRDIAGDDYSGDLQRWDWNGTAWHKVQTILSEIQAGYPVNRPYIPLNHDPEISVIFDTWSWRSPTDATLRVYAWGSNGFVGRTLVSPPSPVETSTDNGHISANSFSLWDGYADTFSQFNPNARTTKWQNVETGDGAGATWSRFDGSAYVITYNASAGTGRKGNSIIGNFPITGNFNVTIKAQVTDPQETGSLSASLCMMSEPNECDPSSGDASFSSLGVLWRHIFAAGNIFQPFNISNGSQNQFGPDISATCNPCWLRLTRSGNDITFWHSGNGASYTLDRTFGFVIAPSTWYVSMSASGNVVTSGSFTVKIDDYILSAGTATGYGKSGQWVSTVQAPSDDVPTTMTINYSGASGTRYISGVYIVSNAGLVLASYTTPIKSGTQITLSFPDMRSAGDSQSWSVKVTLSGDGLGAISVKSITLGTEATIRAQAMDAFWIILFLSVLGLLVVGAWVVRSRYLI